MHNTKEMKIKVRDVALIKGEEKSKGKWSIGIVEEELIQNPLKLHCDMEKSTSKSKNTSHKMLNVDAK